MKKKGGGRKCGIRTIKRMLSPSHGPRLQRSSSAGISSLRFLIRTTRIEHVLSTGGVDLIVRRVHTSNANVAVGRQTTTRQRRGRI